MIQCESFNAPIITTGGRNPLASVGIKPETGHNDMPLKNASTPDQFCIVNVSEEKRLYVRIGSHQSMFYVSAENER